MSDFMSSPYALLTVALVVLAIAVLMLMIWLLSIDRRMRGVADGLEIERRKVAEMQMVIGRRNAARNYGRPQNAPAQGQAMPRERAPRPDANAAQRPAQGRPAQRPVQGQGAPVSAETARPRRERPADSQLRADAQVRQGERPARTQAQSQVGQQVQARPQSQPQSRSQQASRYSGTAEAVPAQRQAAARETRPVRDQATSTPLQTRVATQSQTSSSNQSARAHSSQSYVQIPASADASVSAAPAEPVRARAAGSSRGRHARV